MGTTYVLELLTCIHNPFPITIAMLIYNERTHKTAQTFMHPSASKLFNPLKRAHQNKVSDKIK